MMTLLIISMGSSTWKSTNALREYPVVHLMANFRLIREASFLSDWTSFAKLTMPSTKCLWVCTKRRRVSCKRYWASNGRQWENLSPNSVVYLDRHLKQKATRPFTSLLLPSQGTERWQLHTKFWEILIASRWTEPKATSALLEGSTLILFNTGRQFRLQCKQLISASTCYILPADVKDCVWNPASQSRQDLVICLLRWSRLWQIWHRIRVCEENMMISSGLGPCK